MKNATAKTVKTARKLLASISEPLSAPPAGAYEVLHHGRVVHVTVPPSACHNCGGDGCRECAFTGENLPVA